MTLFSSEQRPASYQPRSMREEEEEAEDEEEEQENEEGKRGERSWRRRENERRKETPLIEQIALPLCLPLLYRPGGG